MITFVIVIITHVIEIVNTLSRGRQKKRGRAFRHGPWKQSWARS